MDTLALCPPNAVQQIPSEDEFEEALLFMAIDEEVRS
jgi:hypothetical protein